MILYPAIDLRGGRCVRLRQGSFDDETVYDADPVSVARGFASAGAEWIHVVDLDAARGQGSNRDVVRAIAEAVDIPVQTGGGVRDLSLLNEGIARVVIGSMAVNDVPAVESLLRTGDPQRVALGLDHRDGRVAVAGWECDSDATVEQLAMHYGGFRPGAFVVTDISRDGMLVGPDVDGLRRLASTTSVPVIASGGVSSLEDMVALRETGVAGVIVGKALYEGRFTVEEALTTCAQ